jgi:hypothetical protein
MSTSSVPFSVPARSRMIFLRSLVWSIVGLVYAPLFAGLLVAFETLGLGRAAFVPAAGIAGAVGASFYGARQVALSGTVIGLVVATVTFFTLPGRIHPWEVMIPAWSVGLILGWLVRFPDRCSLHVPAKALSGLVTGAACGAMLVLVEPLHPQNFHILGAVAFLVSVNGVLYVATVRWWVKLAALNRRQPCNLIEAMVVAGLSAVAAASLWAVSGPFVGVVDEAFRGSLDVLHALLPISLFGGLVGGAVSGALLEAFGFKWVHDV